MKSKVLLLPLFLCSYLACTRQVAQPQIGFSLFSDEIKSAINRVEKSIVGVNTDIVYEVQTYNYVTRNGELVPQPNSRPKYKLASGDAGITYKTDKKTLVGGGLLLDVDRLNSNYTILTSSHLVSPEDTVNVFYMDEEGAKTDVLFARYVLKSSRITVRDGNVVSPEAELIADSYANDLAIIKVEAKERLGREFRNQIGYDLDLDWGDWVFLFGYPKGIKQMSGGWVSKSPYPRTIAIDAVVRFGYSGGPVFTFSKDKTELAFVGVIKSVPRTNLDYIAPDQTLPVGSSIGSQDLPKLAVKRQIMVDYGTAYFVNIKTIKSFIKSSRSAMAKSGIVLHPKFYGK